MHKSCLSVFKQGMLVVMMMGETEEEGVRNGTYGKTVETMRMENTGAEEMALRTDNGFVWGLTAFDTS